MVDLTPIYEFLLFPLQLLYEYLDIADKTITFNSGTTLTIMEITQTLGGLFVWLFFVIFIVWFIKSIFKTVIKFVRGDF